MSTTSQLEEFIDEHYVKADQSSQQGTEDSQDLVHTPTKTRDTAMDTARSNKRKEISPVMSLPSTDMLSDLDTSDHQDQSAILSTVSSWVGEMHNQMQESFTKQFNDAISKMKDELIQHVEESDVTTSLLSHDSQFNDIFEENREIRSRCLVLEGRLTRAEKELDEVREDLLIQQARSMRDNLQFFNIPETNKENCEIRVREFLHHEMKVGDEDLDKIHFERVHRMGPFRQGQKRVIVAKLNPEGKQIIFQHVKHLDKRKKYGISEQLPRELAERKKQLLPRYKQAKMENKQPKWSLDKLVIDGKVQEIKKDKVKDVNIDTVVEAVKAQDRIHHSQPQEHQGSSFQGHSVVLKSQDDVVPALHATYAHNSVARANHNVYAYRLRSPGGRITEYYYDDGEWGAGSKLLNLLRENNIDNKLVCASRWYGGTHMGPARFRCILDVAKESLNLPE